MKIDYEPHPDQLKIHTALRPFCSGLMVLVIAGRRFGKTLLAVNEIIKRAIEIPNARIWYIAPTKDQAYRIAWRILFHYLPREMIAKKRDDRHYVELTNGSLIEFLGTQDQIWLLGAGLHFVVFDEFPTIPWTVWYDVIKPMLMDYNGDALFIGSVPDPKIHDITTEFLEMYEGALYKPTSDCIGFNFSSFSNPFLNQNKLRKDIEDLKSKGRENDAFRIYYGKYTREYGRVFPKFNRDKHVVLPADLPLSWMRLMACDPHQQRPHYSLWAALDEREHWWFYREQKFMLPSEDRQMTTRETAAEIMRIEATAKERVTARFIDPRSSKIEYRAVGEASIGKIFRDCGLFFRDGNSDFNAFFQTLNDLLVDYPEPKFHVTANCEEFIQQIEGLTWESWASLRAREEKGSKDRPKKVRDDYTDCCKYILNSNIRPIDRQAIASFRQGLEQKWAEQRYL